MNLDNLKKAQEYVDKRMSNFETEDRQSHEDTAAAIAHLNENLNYYLRETLDRDSGDRNERIICLLCRHFSYADHKTLRRVLNKKFVFTTSYFVFLQIIFYTLLFSFLYIFMFDKTEFAHKVLYIGSCFIAMICFIPLAALIYDDSDILRFYRIKK